jgi:hypothetical protein
MSFVSLGEREDFICIYSHSIEFVPLVVFIYSHMCSKGKSKLRASKKAKAYISFHSTKLSVYEFTITNVVWS